MAPERVKDEDGSGVLRFLKRAQSRSIFLITSFSATATTPDFSMPFNCAKVCSLSYCAFPAYYNNSFNIL